MWTLVIWTVVASSNAGQWGSFHRVEKDWRPLAQVRDLEACHKAAKHLSINPANYRCVSPT